MIDPSIIEDILKHADIVDVVSTFINVIKKGRNFVAVCPFHDDKNPSMMLSRDKQIFKCFVCGTGGNVITFVQHYEKVSYIQAVKKVAEIIGYNDERLNSFKEVKKVDTTLEPLYNCINDLSKYYEYALTTQEGGEAYDYLIKRNIDDKIQQDFHIGYSFIDGKKSIEFLKSKGVKLGIVTGRSETTCNISLEFLKMTQYFDFFYYGDTNKNDKAGQLLLGRLLNAKLLQSIADRVDNSGCGVRQGTVKIKKSVRIVHK